MSDYLDLSTDYDTEDVTRAFDELSLWSSRFGALLLEHVELRSGVTVLDLGCGSGFPLLELANMHGPGARFVGVDLWARALIRARRKAEVHALRDVLLVRGDGANLPLASGTIDLIVSNLGVNNFADATAAFGECARVCRPGGRLVMTTNPRGHMRELYAAFGEVLVELGLVADGSLERLERQEAHRSTPAQLGERLESAGFDVARTVEDAFTLRYRDGTALLRHPLTRFGFLDGWRSVVDRAREREVFSALEARLNERASSEGVLRMSVPMVYLEAIRRDA